MSLVLVINAGSSSFKYQLISPIDGTRVAKGLVERIGSGTGHISHEMPGVAAISRDAQIADLVLERRCQRAIFFEDPHVARQHEADIQLLERAVTTVTQEAVCITTPKVAQRWCDAAVLRASR